MEARAAVQQINSTAVQYDTAVVTRQLVGLIATQCWDSAKFTSFSTKTLPVFFLEGMTVYIEAGRDDVE